MNEISKMMYNDIRKELEVVWQNARPYVGPKCRACRECNGINCRRIGAERSTTGARNYEKFQRIKIVYDTLYDGGDGSEIDSSVELFGHKFRAPVFSAPFGNVKSFQANTHFDSDYAIASLLRRLSLVQRDTQGVKGADNIHLIGFGQYEHSDGHEYGRRRLHSKAFRPERAYGQDTGTAAPHL